MTRVLYVGPTSAFGINHRYVVFTPAPSRDGGYWVCDCLDAAFPVEDRQVDLYPLYHIDDALSRLEQGKHSYIWIVPDEQSCDQVLNIEDHPWGPIPCTSLYQLDRTRMEDHDLEPLVGKYVLLIASRDEHSRSRMHRLRLELNQQGVETALSLLPGNSGESIGDMIARDGLTGAREWLHAAGAIEDPNLPAVDYSDDGSVQDIEENSHFTILGLVGNDIAVRIKRTHGLTLVPHTTLTHEGHLLYLAPFKWWLKLAGAEHELSAAERNLIGDKLNRVAAIKGFVDVDAPVFGRGAFPYGERRHPHVGYNLGNRLLLADEDGRLSREVPMDSVDLNLVPGAPIDLHEDAKVQDYGSELVDALMAYRWDSEESAKAFLGWIVTSLIGGALPFRPALWIVGSSGCGKTYLIDVLDDIFGPLATGYIRPTKSGWNGFARFDSLPCLVDGIEPDRDGELWPRVRGLVRQLTTGRGRLARTGQPRCSLTIATKKLPELTRGEMQRLCFLRFAQPVADWAAVDDSIAEATLPHKMLALRTRIIRHAPFLIEKARAMERGLLHHAANGAATREAEMWGALTAGYGFLSGDYDPIRQVAEAEDEYSVLRMLLWSQVETAPGNQGTIADLVRSKDSDLRAVATRYGFKLINDGAMAIAHGHAETLALLHATPYAHTDLNAYLKGIGAQVWKTAKGHPERLNCGGGIRRVSRVVPKHVLTEIGLDQE